jgi:hypothetical protein
MPLILIVGKWLSTGKGFKWVFSWLHCDNLGARPFRFVTHAYHSF